MTIQMVLLATALVAALMAVAPTTALRQGEQQLRRLSRDKNEIIRGNGAFVDGTETVYDDGSLAWRFLGFYTDCNVCIDGDEDGDDEEFSDPSNCLENGEDKTVCRRYALWAAYVDEGYEGNGKNEYQYYDRKHHKWDDSECNSSDKNARCVKMDCHDPSSKNFKLLGVYKDHKTDAFLENMIGYSGDCVWNDDEYKFMQAMNNNDNNNGDYWPPKKCSNHNGYYYDALPSAGGNLQVGLYSDDTCTTPLEDADNVNMKNVLGRSSDDLDSWNSAMDAFKICQPCVSYDTLFLESSKSKHNKHSYNANGDRYGDQQQQQGDDDNAEEEEEPFVCRDNLDRDEPINQCQVFIEEGENTMSVATYRDILLAESQGSVTGIDLSPSSKGGRGKLIMGEPFVQPRHKWLSILLLLLSGVYFWHALSALFEKDRSKNSDSKKNTLKESLMVRRSRSQEQRSRSQERRRSRSPAVVASSSRKTKQQQKAAEKKEERKAQRKEQKPKKSILKKSKNYDDDNSQSEDGSYYSNFKL